MTNTLALLGGTPVRTRPFPTWPIFDEADEARVLAALRSGKWGRLAGEQVAEFEQRFATMHGCRHGIAVVNGTVSLRIALMAAGLQAEDEVIVPAYTFLSTATAVVEANCVPVFVDVDLATFNMDPDAVRAAITPRTRAIIPVHFAGQPADMEALLGIAQAARTLRARGRRACARRLLASRPAGSIGHVGSFSFQSSKNLTAGEGGIIVTNDDTLAAACRSIHNCGRVPDGIWYEHHVISGNYRLGELQGALLNSQLDRLEEQTASAGRERALPRTAARRDSGPVPAARPDCVHATQPTPLHAADGRRRVRSLARVRAGGAAGRGHSLRRRLWLPAARSAAVQEQGVRPVPGARPRSPGLHARLAAPTANASVASRASGSISR